MPLHNMFYRMFKASVPAIILLVLTLIVFLAVAPVNAETDTHKFVAVGNGDDFIVALRDDGTVWTWGRIAGEIFPDKSTYTDRSTPLQVNIDNVTAISVGGAHCLMLKTDGSVWSWGFNDDGQLGDGTNTGTNRADIRPVQVSGLDNIISISSGGSNSLALKDDGSVWSWGGNWNGQLGDGTFEDREVPVRLTGLNNVSAIFSGSFAVKDDGTVWTWGRTLLNPDNEGYVTDDQKVLHAMYRPDPYPIPGLRNITCIDTDFSQRHVIFTKDDGTVWCWGYDSLGQLGYGTNIISNPKYLDSPVRVKGLADIKEVSAGTESSMALKSDGTVWVWGHNGGGQLGTGKPGEIYTLPVKLSGPQDVVSITSKSMNSAFLTRDGSVWVCGHAYAGQKGDGTIDRYNFIETPIKVLGPGNYNPVNITITSQDNDTVVSQLSNTTSSVNPEYDFPDGLISMAIIVISLLFLIMVAIAYIKQIKN